MASGVKILLDYLGIRNFLYSHKPKNFRENIAYRVIINGVDGLEKWMEMIGSKNPVKLSRYHVWKKFGFCPTNLSLEQREGLLNGKLHIKDIELVS